MASDPLMTLTCEELRTELRLRGMKQTGVKAELIRRLNEETPPAMRPTSEQRVLLAKLQKEFKEPAIGSALTDKEACSREIDRLTLKRKEKKP